MVNCTLLWLYFRFYFTFIAAHVNLSLVKAAVISGLIKTPIFKVGGAEKSQIAFTLLAALKAALPLAYAFSVCSDVASYVIYQIV